MGLIPANVLSGLHQTAAVAHKSHTQNMRTNISHQTNLGRAIVNRRMDEPSPLGFVSSAKILKLPKKA